MVAMLFDETLYDDERRARHYPRMRCHMQSSRDDHNRQGCRHGGETATNAIGHQEGAERASNATYRWAEAPSPRTTTNKIDPLSTAASDGDYGELAVTQATRFIMFRATGCHDAVRMRQFNAHYGAIYIATSRDDLLPCRYRYRMRTTIGNHAGESMHTEMQFYRPTPSGRR